MKKIKTTLSVLLALVLALSFTITTFAVEKNVKISDESQLKLDNATANEKYKDKFEKSINYDYLSAMGVTYDYKELYNYYSVENTTETPDWVLIYGTTTVCSPAFCYGIFDGYILTRDSIGYPYTFGYGVYVPKEDKFYDISSVWNSDLPEIRKVFTENLNGGNTRLMGDNDADGELTVMDATYMQRALAEQCEYRADDIVSKDNGLNMGPSSSVKYISDYNRDGQRTIMDATAIQSQLASLD